MGIASAALTSRTGRLSTPGTLTNIFIETTTPETFSSLYEQLAPRLRESVVQDAKMNAANFEECIAWARREGVDADGWVGCRDWARAQPWFPEALTNAAHNKSLEVPYDAELARQLAFLEGELLRATTDGGREDIDYEIAGVRKELARLAAGGRAPSITL